MTLRQWMRTSQGKLETCARDARRGSGLTYTCGLHLCLHAHWGHPEKTGPRIAPSGAPGKRKQWEKGETEERSTVAAYDPGGQFENRAVVVPGGITCSSGGPVSGGQPCLGSKRHDVWAWRQSVKTRLALVTVAATMASGRAVTGVMGRVSRAGLGGGEMYPSTGEAPNNLELGGGRGGLRGSKIFVFVSCFFVCFGLFLNWREFKHVKASGGGRSEGRAKYNRERGECRQCFSGVAKKERGSKAELRCSVFLTEEAAPLPLWAGYSVAKSARSRRQRGRNCKHCPEIEKLVSSLWN